MTGTNIKAFFDCYRAKLGIDLVNNPDLALKPDIAAKIMIVGMSEGTFTGKKLSDYFNNEISDAYNARKIINGRDKAGLIQGYYNQNRMSMKDVNFVITNVHIYDDAGVPKLSFDVVAYAQKANVTLQRGVFQFRVSPFALSNVEVKPAVKYSSGKFNAPVVESSPVALIVDMAADQCGACVVDPQWSGELLMTISARIESSANLWIFWNEHKTFCKDDEGKILKLNLEGAV